MSSMHRKAVVKDLYYNSLTYPFQYLEIKHKNFLQTTFNAPDYRQRLTQKDVVKVNAWNTLYAYTLIQLQQYPILTFQLTRLRKMLYQCKYRNFDVQF